MSENVVQPGIEPGSPGIYIYIQLCIQYALPVVTIMALWQLLNLGTGCTVTHCWIALWSHESAQTASSEQGKYANSEHLSRGSPPNPESAQTV